MLSLTQIELRKVISQELADAGINRNTLVDMVHKAVDDKVQKKVQNVAVTELAAASAVAIGAAVVDTYLMSKN